MTRPHMSSAIVQLRLWVLWAAAVMVLACTTQLLVFGFVHYTDVRWNVLEPKAERVKAEVVRAQPHALADKPSAEESGPKPAEPNRVLSAVDTVMDRAAAIATVTGAVACVTLTFLITLGVVVGAGAQIPGVERSVRACAWSLVLAMLVLPLKDILPSLPWPGVFSSYASLTAASDAARESGTGGLFLFMVYLLKPLVALVGTVTVAVWFRSGVERGMLVSDHLDAALERELASVRSNGVAVAPAGSGARAMGALNRTLGPESDLRLAAGAESLGSLGAMLRPPPPEDDGPSIGQIQPGHGERRLI